MNKTIQWKKTQPGSTEAVQFSDGMLVTAEDLSAAMRYPLAVIQVLLKAYFGCGIVCGLDLKDPAVGQDSATNGDRRPGGTEATPKPEPNFILTVEKGVALGCDGYPIEVCGPLKLDLTPDPCRPEMLSKPRIVAARRVTAAEAAARPCGCGATGGEPAQQCTRRRDHVLVQAFYEDQVPPALRPAALLPAREAAQGKEPARTGELPTAAASLCDCLKQCGECACCGEPWLLLGTVIVNEDGLGEIDRTGRRYVKPIACVCDTARQVPRATRAEMTMDDVIAQGERGRTPAAR
ncbi:MAG: hypothetical protein QOI38_1499 [Sphingomonadales bacterium]|jgi:hypothetical protein|nr:hypothetical protein [Sphingomonadales bacterium]